MTAISGFFDYYLGEGVQQGVTMQSVAVFFSLNFAAMSTIVYLLISYFIRHRDMLQAHLDEQHKLLQAEQEKSERLLLNILPGPIAERLKEQHATIADGFADVTVMFSDIINFTQLSEEMPPKFMVTMLNEVFSHFDRLAEQRGLEKIKTIGDAYMIVAGVPEPRDDHAQVAVEMALAMHRVVSAQPPVNGRRLEVRIGIASGPLVAGVIGERKFSYDLWGDTVNTASRMESSGIPGCVHITTETLELLDGRYPFERRDAVEVKGKGPMTTWTLDPASIQA
jgi:class 3 adenylate cyclase